MTHAKKQKTQHAHIPKKTLKKRAVFEIIGLIVLLGVCYNQRHIIGLAIDAIRKSDVFYLSLLLGMYWVLLPISALNYRILSGKNLSIFKTSLVHLAGAGPGRIIPGGLGQLSVGTTYLKNVGLPLQKAIIVAVTNNIIGVITNITILSIVLMSYPDIYSIFQDTFTGKRLLLMLLIVLFIVMVFFLLSHVRAIKKAMRKAHIQWSSLLRELHKHPKKMIALFSVASTITISHTFMVILAAKALGIEMSFSDALIALSAGVFIGGMLPTPGGLGAVEAGSISALLVLGFPVTEATSVALLFRTANYWQPLIPGVFSYLYLKEQKLL